MNTNEQSLLTNLRLYPWFYILFSAYAWASVFFLYFSERVSVDQVLILEAVYYCSVVFLEVPSGFFSDVFGRKKTLIIATLFQVASYFLFFTGTSFMTLCWGQLCLALSFAFASGTDQALHYESLKSVGRGSEFGQREAQIMKKAMIFRALSQVVAGGLAVLALKYAYGLSLILSLMAFFLVIRFKEPQQKIEGASISFFKQLRACFAYLKVPKLLWITGFIFIYTICTHFPYEFFQKYFALLDISKSLSFDETPLVSGIVGSSAIFIAAFVAGRSVQIKNAIGFPRLILLSLLVNAVILFGMSYFLSFWVGLLILMRSLPSALSQAPLRAEIAPLIQDSERATFMSINSLLGRLGYGFVLFVLSYTVKDKVLDWATLSSLLQVGLAIAAAGLITLGVTSPKINWSKSKA